MEDMEFCQWGLLILGNTPDLSGKVLTMQYRIHAWLSSLHEDVVAAARLYGVEALFPYSWGYPPDPPGLTEFMEEHGWLVTKAILQTQAMFSSSADD